MIEWPVVLRTKRLTLRPFEPGDAPDVCRLAGDREIAANTLTVPHPYEQDMASEWIEGHAPAAVAGEKVVFALVHSSGLVGAMGLDLAPEHSRAELGYWIGRPMWGQGFASEAARELVRYGFEFLGLNRIEAHHMTRNPASGRVLENCGMRKEGVVRQHLKKWDQFEDIVLYGILASDWAHGSSEETST
ncbi:MAG: GNAT family N-acetyltransferase [Gemmatimonadota bacterium]